MPTLLTRVRGELKRISDPAKAPIMQAYMKSAMPYHGVQTPALKALCRGVFADVELPSAEKWQREVLALWRGARFREERYAALHLSGHRRAREYQDPKAMPMYEELIVTGAWWDYVDMIASRRVGPILAAHPAPMKKKMLSWSRSPDLWKRRTSIICQLGFRRDVDLKLLFDCIEPSLGSKEFFLQKGIGWALRQVSWTNPKVVASYVREHERELSALSRREALKRITSPRTKS